MSEIVRCFLRNNPLNLLKTSFSVKLARSVFRFRHRGWDSGKHGLD